jgi:hypothetical protein
MLNYKIKKIYRQLLLHKLNNHQRLNKNKHLCQLKNKTLFYHNLILKFLNNKKNLLNLHLNHNLNFQIKQKYHNHNHKIIHRQNLL